MSGPCCHYKVSCCCKQAFKEQKYPEAVKFYTEALARGPPKVNPDAHKVHSNRAACYTKLGAWDAGLKDADECIKLKPDFTKGYVRKVLPYAGCMSHTAKGVTQQGFCAVSGWLTLPDT